MSCEEKNCVFVRNKSNKTCFVLKLLLPNCCLKNESIIHNIAFSGENSLVWIRREICTDQALFTTTGDGLFHWRKCYYALCKLKLFKIKNVLMDLFLTNMQLFTSQDINWWTGVVWITCGLLWCFYQLFYQLSFWRHPFTAEDPLLSNWCNATFL